MIDLVCSKCGNKIKIVAGGSAVHASCPKRGPRSAPPPYVPAPEVRA